LATPLSHLAFPLALGAALGGGLVPPGLLVLACACAVLPDLDALGLWLGIPYEHPLGHRGLTHSLPFAAVLAGVGSLLAPATGAQPAVAFWVLFVSAASHGMLDALTNGGLGIAFFGPFSNRRHFLPWRVIEVSPLRPSALFSWRGLRVLHSEIRWVWVPCLTVALLGFALRGVAGRV
jgi:inner membrane protein